MYSATTKVTSAVSPPGEVALSGEAVIKQHLKWRGPVQHAINSLDVYFESAAAYAVSFMLRGSIADSAPLGWTLAKTHQSITQFCEELTFRPTHRKKAYLSARESCEIVSRGHAILYFSVRRSVGSSVTFVNF